MLKSKELCDALGLIYVIIDDDEMVQICLGGLAPCFSAIRSAILARENPPSFFDLQSILLVEENHARQRSNTPDGHMLYSQSDEEIPAMETEVVMIDRIKSVTLTNGKRIEMVPENSAEGGIITSEQATVET